MSQKVKISFFIFSELINIILELISFFQLELALFHRKTAKDFVLLAFSLDHIFGVFKFY